MSEQMQSSQREEFKGLVPGRIVYFMFGAQSATAVNERRRDVESSTGVLFRKAKSGVVMHTGSMVFAGDILPAMVTRVRSNGVVNLKVMLDGNDTYWATEVPYDVGKHLDTWHWMFEGQAGRYTPDRIATPAASRP